MEGSTTKCNNFNVSSIEVVALGCGAFHILSHYALLFNKMHMSFIFKRVYQLRALEISVRAQVATAQ